MNDSFKLAPGEWSTLRRLLDQALDTPATERADWLDALGPEDAPFRPRLQALLAHAGDAPAKETVARLLDTLPQVETAQFAPAPHDAALAAGSTVGPYRLLRPLGEGGMGEVWLAERTDLLQQRQVALKLPRLVTGRARLAERLAREREILATLEHPNIARLYDAGLGADGQPWLALEYVEGERIDAWCARKALNVPARLRLFLQVARAVAHAHGRLVVHRDLKPANLLVTEAGDVRLLDFGIAKLLEDGRAQETELTQLAGRALTPDYAAPEQILGQPIGTAADVYALGVVLFELLTGSRPYKLKRDSRAALEEAIAQAEVQRPSSVVGDARLRRRLRGDLDTIVLKALKRAPAERYSSVEALADDIERHLDQRPVRARPDRPGYRATRFLSRNRYAVAAVTAVLVTALAGAATSIWQARLAERERDTALREKKNADEVKTFVLSMLRDAGPNNSAGKVLSAQEMLQRARGRIDTIDPARAEVRAELLTTVADSLLMLDDARGAEAVLRQAVAEAVPRLGAEHGLVLRARSMLAQSYRRQSRYGEMQAVLEAILPPLRQREDKLPNLLLSALVNLSNLNGDLFRFADADRAVQEGLALIDRRFNGRHVNSTLLLARRSQHLVRSGDAVAGLAHAERAVKLALEMHGGNARHAMVLFARSARADALLASGRTDEAVTLMDAVLADTEAAFDGRARQYAQRLMASVPIYLQAGPPERVLAATAEALRIMGRFQGSDELELAKFSADRGHVLLATGRADEALAPLAQAESAMRGALGDGSALTTLVAHDLAWALAASGQPARAAEVLDRTPAPKSLPYPSMAVQSWAARAEVARLAGRTTDADAAWREAAALADRLPHVPAHVRRVIDRERLPRYGS
ncbi:MAG: serine/threonine-protein kinase [Burkholderiaceae bacterium]|nr:serine/threonine-protein kinase [Burkholderiaceae bacterium]